MTRNEYLRTGATQDEAFAAHQEYYAQYVDDSILSYVESAIGKKKILASNDRSFNDIPLMQWDNLEYILRHRVDKSLLKLNGEGWSLSTSVCIAKQAARIIKQKG